jgi:hypothetical protein
VGEERCAFVRAMVLANKAMATRSNLEQEVANWLDEFGTLPPGNGVEKDLWEGSSGASASTASEGPRRPALLPPRQLARRPGLEAR